MSMKYTTDGKKVVVIGKLNATETIVQEIFVGTDGSEIPSGEQFVTKSLHDKPVVSWSEKRTAEIKAALARWEKQLDDVMTRVRVEERKAHARINALSVVATKATAESFALLEDFVAGRITHVLIDCEYGDCRIALFNDLVSEDREYPEYIKLLSLFGKSDGTLQWRIHQYYDYSGSSRLIIPAHSIEEARQLAQKQFDAAVDAWRLDSKKRPPCPDSYKEADRSPLIGLRVPEDVVAYWKEFRAQEKAKRVAQLEAELEKAKNS